MALELSLRHKIERANEKSRKDAGQCSRLPARKRAYIAGKVGDLTDDDYYYEVLRKFDQRERELRKLGYRIVNPMKLVKRGTVWNLAMKICIAELLQCDVISPLPDVQQSPGAIIEMSIASRLNYPFVFPSKINSKQTQITE
jgi:hypothetical protein